MGLARKIMWASTGGAVDFRSAEKRTARNTAKIARYEEKSYGLVRDAALQQQSGTRAALDEPTTSDDDLVSDEAMDFVEALERLADLRDDDMLSEDEFQTAKAKLLDLG